MSTAGRARRRPPAGPRPAPDPPSGRPGTRTGPGPLRRTASRIRRRANFSVRNRGRASYQCAMTEFDDVIRLLEENRPQASNQELDAIKQRVRRRAAEPSRRSQSMKSRVAILGMLVTGILFSTAGAGLALSGTNNNASIAQYGTV